MLGDERDGQCTDGAGHRRQSPSSSLSSIASLSDRVSSADVVAAVFVDAVDVELDVFGANGVVVVDFVVVLVAMFEAFDAETAAAARRDVLVDLFSALIRLKVDEQSNNNQTMQ